MRDPRLHTEWWDNLKYISLRDDGETYLTLGGETRLRYEMCRHPAFGSDLPDDGGYLLQRYLLHGDLHLGSRVRVFAQLQSSLESGRNGGPRAFDADSLDLHQASPR